MICKSGLHKPAKRSLGQLVNAALLAFVLGSCLTASRAQSGTALVRHAPVINGTLDGFVEQMTGEAAVINSGGVVTGDLLVPGIPTLKLNGSPVFGGVIIGSGSASPSGYQITLNSGVRLGHLQTRIDALTLSSVAVPSSPAGTRNVSLNAPGQSPGDFGTLHNLTLNSNVGQVAVPAGAYGDFTANSGSGFTLGTVGATVASSYSFQHLTLNSNTQLNILGPVVITVANTVSINSSGGSSDHPEWLALQLSSGGLTLNTSAIFYASVLAPNGTVTINSNAQLVGKLVCDRLTLNTGSLLRVVSSTIATVALIAPANNSVFAAPANITLQATASNADNSIAQVNFFNGGTLLGSATVPPYQFNWTGVTSGSYSLTAAATDTHGMVTVSPPVSIVSDAPPVVSLSSPAPGAVFPSPANILLSASASDSDGNIAKVEFFAGSSKLGEATAAPYQYQWSGAAAGNYTLTATATDNLGVKANSASIGIVVDTPPSITVAGPADGVALASPASITLTASATASNSGTIASVEFYRGATLIGTLTTPTVAGTSNYVLTDSTLLPGTYTYRVRTYDNFGAFTDSDPLIVTVLAGLPYLSNFEGSDGYSLGSLDGQLGWSVIQGAAVVSNSDALSGTQSVLLAPTSPPALVTQTFAPLAGEGVVFADFYTKPVADSDISAATNFIAGTTHFAFLLNSIGQGTLQALNGDGLNGGQWTSTPFSVPLTSNNQSQDKLRLTARLDFTRQTWDLYANGTMVAADLGFSDNSSTYFGVFALQGHKLGPTLFDDFFAVADNPLFTDSNNNGIDDAWEVDHGLSLSNYNRNLSPSGNGISVIQAYLKGTDPNDFYNGQLPRISISSGDHQITPPGQFNVQSLRVLVQDSTGTVPLANAPVSFSVIQGGGLLSLSNSGSSTLSSSLAVHTDADGTAQLFYQQPSTPATSSQISATAATAQVVFQTATVGDDYYNGSTPTIISLQEPDGSLSSDGALSVLMQDAAGEPLVNAPVVFTAKEGGHLLSATAGGTGSTSVEVITNEMGFARAYVVPGQ